MDLTPNTSSVIISLRVLFLKFGRRINVERVLKEGLMAFVPEYVEHRGNCTMMYGKDLEPLVMEKSIKTIIRLIAKYYFIDLNEIKKRYKPLVSSPNLVPIPFSKKDIFVPIKTRKPMIKNDGAFGYINMRYIKDIKKRDGSPIIHLMNGVDIQCLCSMETVDKHIRDGHIINRCYEDRYMTGVAEAEAMYNTLIPATKADIAMILSRLPVNTNN